MMNYWHRHFQNCPWNTWKLDSHLSFAFRIEIFVFLFLFGHLTKTSVHISSFSLVFMGLALMYVRVRACSIWHNKGCRPLTFTVYLYSLSLPSELSLRYVYKFFMHYSWRLNYLYYIVVIINGLHLMGCRMTIIIHMRSICGAAGKVTKCSILYICFGYTQQYSAIDDDWRSGNMTHIGIYAWMSMTKVPQIKPVDKWIRFNQQIGINSRWQMATAVDTHCLMIPSFTGIFPFFNLVVLSSS